jgi:protease-4
MSYKDINQEVSNPKSIAGDEILKNDASNERETLIPIESIQNAKGNSSHPGSAPASQDTGKTVYQETSFDTPEKNKASNENFNMNSNPSQQKKHNWTFYLLISLALVAVILVSIAAISYSLGFGGDIGSSNKVAVIYVQGTILSGNVPTGLGYATSEEISENIRSAVADEGVKAIVLRINSPGGSPAAAQEIVGEIEKVQAKGIPVVVSMGDLAASAAYYISAPADYIFANPSTSTGSIGVIWTFQNISGYNSKEGIDYYISKSGEFKDMGGTWRGLTDQEKEYADSVVMESYEDFVNEVSKGRNISRSDVKNLADGRIYTGSRAKELGLIDGFGNLYDAIDKAGELAGIIGKPEAVYMNRASLSRLFLGSDSDNSSTEVKRFVSYFEESPYGKIFS